MKPKTENQGIKGKLNYARQDRYKIEEKKETKTGNYEIQADKVREQAKDTEEKNMNREKTKELY